MSSSFSPCQFTVNELEFLAEDTHITILPLFTAPSLKFIEAEYGPFRPQFPLSVPLWLALNLRKAKKCQLKVPLWLEQEALEHRISMEKKSTKLIEIPFHYDEIARLILFHGREDLVDPGRTEELLGDLRDIRQIKVRNSLNQIQLNTRVLDVGNIAAMELNMLRDPVSKAMEAFQEMRQAAAGEAAGTEGMQESGERRGGVIQQGDTSFSQSQPAPSQDIGLSQAEDAQADADDPQGLRKLRRFR